MRRVGGEIREGHRARGPAEAADAVAPHGKQSVSEMSWEIKLSWGLRVCSLVLRRELALAVVAVVGGLAVRQADVRRGDVIHREERHGLRLGLRLRAEAAAARQFGARREANRSGKREAESGSAGKTGTGLAHLEAAGAGQRHVHADGVLCAQLCAAINQSIIIGCITGIRIFSI